MYLCRPFKVGRQLEDAFGGIGEQEGPAQSQGPTPEEVAAQLKQAELEHEAKENELDRQSKFEIEELKAVTKSSL